MSILRKHLDDNFYTRKFDDFVGRLERGELPFGALLPHDCYGAKCPTCDEDVVAFKYRGERYDLHEIVGRWIIHQCPQPEDECWPDDPNVRDGDGNIRGGGWSDDTWAEPQDFADDPYNYPDVPYAGHR